MIRIATVLLVVGLLSSLGSNAAHAQQSDLTLSQIVSNPTPNVGDFITYTITLTNNGPDTATNVSVSDLLPGGLTFASAIPSQGSYDSATGLWSAGTVAIGVPQTLVITATVVSPNSSTNTATIVHSDQTDPNSGNNSSSATVTPQQADLSITKTVSNPTPNINDVISYTITLTNNGPSSNATNVTVQDILPAGLSFVSATLSLGTYNPGTGVWTVGNVATSSPETLLIQARVSNQTTTNTATISHSDQTDPTPGNNSASVSTSPPPAASTISQSFGNASIPLNGTTSLTFTITNSNALALTGVRFTDTLPSGLVVATPNGLTGSCGAGTVTAAAGSSSISLTGGTIAANGSCTFSLNVMGTSSGTKTNTTSAVVSNEGGTGNSATASLLVGTTAQTATTLTSSANPSQAGQAVTFTAKVTSSAGTPTGTVTFKDGTAVIGTAALSAGAAAFTTSSLTQGSHSITASYGGAPSFVASTSSALIQIVSVPADSLKLRAMQVMVAPVEAQVSGQAITGAINSAVSEGFGEGGGNFISPSGSGVRFNFAADPDAKPADAPVASANPFAGINSPTNPASAAPQAVPRGGGASSRVDDAFGALAYAAPTKAPPARIVEPPDWLGWAEVHGAILNHWNPGTLTTPSSVSVLYGDQINVLAGLTRRLRPNFLVGVLGGYETFDYRSDALEGRLKGDGWTVGSYLGWMLTSHLRFDAAVTYSGIGYDGSAGTAAANFAGHRLLASGGITGTYESYGWQIEPSARLYAIWEHEDAYTDTLGTSDAARDFSTGRASGGVKLTYPVAWSPTVQLAPYVGVYGDYYFNADTADATAIVSSSIPIAVVLDGWSARATGGLTARFAGGAQVSVGGERSGIGSGFSLWTYRATASVPFAAQ